MSRTRVDRKRLETLDDETVIAAFRNGFFRLNRSAVSIAADVEEGQVSSWASGLNVNDLDDRKIRNALKNKPAPKRERRAEGLTVDSTYGMRK